MKKPSKRGLKPKKRSFEPNWLVFFALLSVGAFVLFVVVQPMFTSANTPDPIFSDNFDQSSSSLKNGWKAINGSPSRTGTNSVSSPNALNFKGGSGSDDSAQRHIATKGYDTLHISYKVKSSSLDTEETITTEYYLDEVLVDSDVVTSSATNESISLDKSKTLSNTDRHTKLTIRFTVSADNSSDIAGIDDLAVTGENPPLFYDGLESGGFVEGDWVSDGDTSIVHDDVDYDAGDLDGIKIWTDDNNTATGHSTGDHLSKAHGTQLKGDNDSTPGDGVLIKARDTSGYKDIKVRYARRVNDLESGDNFKSYYSIDGGENWIETPLEILTDVNDSDGFASVIFGPLEGANNNPNFRIKFELNGNSNNDEAFLDDVVIWGDPAPTGSVTIVKEAGPESEQEFDFEPSFDDEFVLVDDGESSNSMTFENISTGTHTVTETVPEDWSLTSIVCNDADSTVDVQTGIATIQVAENEHVTCTFTNTKIGTIIVEKITVPSGDDTLFAFTGNLTGEISHGGTLENKVWSEGGPYPVTESGMEGWDLTDISCNGENSSGSIETGTATFNVEAGEIVTCTFTNTKRGEIIVTKIAEGAQGEFTFTLSGGQLSEALIVIFNGTFSNLTDSWTFENLLPNYAYSLSEEVPENWQGNQQVSCSNDSDPSSISLNPGESVNCIFNNTEFGVISGRKFEDMNSNGNDNEGSDQGLGGWVITLSQYEDEGEEDGYWEEVDSTETDSETGRYMFSGLLSGEYRICETLQSGWHQTMPGDGTTCYVGDSGTTYGYTVEISAGQISDGNNFGNYQKGSISGVKFEDVNGNGVKDEGEPALPDWTIKLSNGENTNLASTDVNGSYIYNDLLPGAYTVSEDQQAGWIQTMPENSRGYSVNLISGQNLNEKDFGNFKSVTITGFKWDDKNGDGIWQKTDVENPEPGLQDVTVALGRQNGDPRQENGHETIPIEIVALSLTSADGSFTIHDVGPGRYKLFEENKSGWQATNPAPSIDSLFDITYAIGDPDFDLLRLKNSNFNSPSFFDIFVESGKDVNQIEFGNHLLSVNPPTSSGSSSGGGGGGNITAHSLMSEDDQKYDLNKDGKIDILDLNTLMVHWGETGGGIGDFNGDGVVDILDFGLLMVHWSV